jgi:hypothetical protein
MTHVVCGTIGDEYAERGQRTAVQRLLDVLQVNICLLRSHHVYSSSTSSDAQMARRTGSFTSNSRSFACHITKTVPRGL